MTFTLHVLCVSYRYYVCYYQLMMMIVTTIVCFVIADQQGWVMFSGGSTNGSRYLIIDR